jgi:hypothetical protein
LPTREREWSCVAHQRERVELRCGSWWQLKAHACPVPRHTQKRVLALPWTLATPGRDANEGVVVFSVHQLSAGLVGVVADGDYGMDYMAQVGQDYQQDPHVMPRFLAFVQCEGDLLDEVENLPELVEEVKELKAQLFAGLKAQVRRRSYRSPWVY